MTHTQLKALGRLCLDDINYSGTLLKQNSLGLEPVLPYTDYPVRFTA